MRRLHASTKGPWNRRSLGFPGFPVKSCGFGQLHVVLFRENHISGAVESCDVGKPGTLGMTKERATVPWRVIAEPRRFHYLGWAAGLRPPPVETTSLLAERFLLFPGNTKVYIHNKLVISTEA
jgi:hypothetical protein